MMIQREVTLDSIAVLREMGKKGNLQPNTMVVLEGLVVQSKFAIGAALKLRDKVGTPDTLTAMIDPSIKDEKLREDYQRVKTGDTVGLRGLYIYDEPPYARERFNIHSITISN